MKGRTATGTTPKGSEKDMEKGREPKKGVERGALTGGDGKNAAFNVTSREASVCKFFTCSRQIVGR